MVDLARDETMVVLEPFLDDIDACLREGMATYKKYASRHLAEHSDRATRACIHDHQVMEARRRLEPLAGVSIINVRGLAVVNFHDSVLLRFKKVNGAGRGRNLQTMQQRLFDRQLELPGLPKQATRVIAGYHSGPTGLEINKILISCPMGKSILWCVQVILGEKARWVDITPIRIPGTEQYTRYDHTGGQRPRSF